MADDVYVSYEDWVANQPLKVRRIMAEQPWVVDLCRAAWKACVAKMRMEALKIAADYGDDTPSELLLDLANKMDLS